MPTSINNKKFKARIDSKENFYLIQPYLNFVHKFNDKTSLNTGVFSQLLTLNNKFVFEPRVSLRHQFSSKHMLNLSYGIHSQMQSTYLYFAIPDSIIQENKPTINTNQQQSNTNLDFSKSQHLVFGYDYFVTSHFKLKLAICS